MALERRCFILLAAAAVFPFVLTACGDEVTEEHITQVAEEKILVVADVSELPNCSSENEGRQALVKGESSTRICVDGIWFATFTETQNDFKCFAEYLLDGSGLKIICNGDSIGVVLNGLNGTIGPQGEQGINGANGKSAYEIAKAGGYSGSETEWIESLKGENGANGKSAYEIAKAGGYTGSETEWIESLKGENGANGKSAYEIAKAGGYSGSETEWIESLKGENGANGKSAYEIAKAGGYTGSETEWIESLKGENGANGKSAYEIAKENGFTGSETEWLESLKGMEGNSGADACSVERVGEVITIDCGQNKVSFTGAFVYGTLIDERDQKTYKTVVIGEQTWMAENLNYTDTIAYPSMKKRFIYLTDTFSSKYGCLYPWAIAMDSAGTFSSNARGCGYLKTCKPTYPVRGICPKGWHLPTFMEFKTLITAVGGDSIAGKMLKSSLGWRRDWEIGDGTDAFGFSALPTGYYKYSELSLQGGDIYAFFWSSTEDSPSLSNRMGLSFSDRAYLINFAGDKRDYISVRCIKDSE